MPPRHEARDRDVVCSIVTSARIGVAIVIRTGSQTNREPMTPLLLTLLLVLGSVSVALPLGIGYAWFVHSLSGSPRRRGWQRFWLGLLLLQIALPLYLHASAWEAAAGKFGWLPLMQTGGNRFWFTGLPAAVWVHGVQGSAWVALATLWGLRTIPREITWQAALDSTPGQRWWRVDLPLARPAIGVGVLWVALLATTEMTVADLYSVRTLADRVYLQYAYEPEWRPILLTCLVPMAFALPLAMLLGWLARRSFQAPGDGSSAIDEPRPVATSRSSAARFGFVFGGALMIFLAALPFVSLIVKGGLLVQPAGAFGATRYRWSASRFAETLGRGFTTFGEEYRWTLILVLATASVALLIALPAAAWADRWRWRQQLLFAVAVLVFVIPGPVTGMLILKIFPSSSPFLGMLAQRTLLPTVVALLVRALPAAYFICRGGFRMLDPQPGLAAMNAGAGAWTIFWHIQRPRLHRTASLALVTAGLVAAADLPVTLIVAPPGVSTVSTRLFGLLHSGVRYDVAALTLTFYGFLVLSTWLVTRLALSGSRRVG